jgi:CRISPR-associated endonuclease/helicase Cas3
MDVFLARFEQLTGHQPYPWQTRLFDSLVAGHIPQNLGAPTGAGKTNVIPCWLLALVQNPDLPHRLVYVVDRRSVVDQSTKVVEEIYAKISANESLAASLNLSEGLGISTLRGEYADNQQWSRLPYRPSVVCGTVDMVGSRLLFSGYGDGAYSRALHAGLLGNDTLIVFDECHLVPAFATLLENIQHAGGKLKPFHVMLMSATGSSGSDISLNDDDLNTEPLKSRLQAVKAVQVINHPQPIKKIITLAKDSPPKRTIVFVQSPSTAVEIGTTLHNSGKVVLLTGTMRGKERDDLVDNPVFQAFTKAEEPAEPHFLVATSAGEVGIDLTCSRLVTDATYAPSLVQRFGRCNRFAECEAAQIHVITCDKDWAIYGDDLNFIKSLDGDVSCINLWKRREDVAKLTKVPPMIPTVEPHVLDILSMTSLHNDVPVDEYLRGRQKDSRYVDICFREEAELLAGMNESDFYDYLKCFPVLSFEKLSENAKRLQELVAEVQSSTKCVVILPDGTKVGTTLSELPRGLTNCLLILPEHCGLGLQGGMLVKSDNGGLLDISTIEHKHHPARIRLILPADQEYAPSKNEKVVFNRAIGDKRIVIVKEKQRKAHETELLSEHNEAVRQAARQFAEKAGLSVDIANAIEQAGCFHDAGKSGLWQLAAEGGDIKNPIAKTWRLYPAKLKGFRHEFESMDYVDLEMAKHLVGAHHAGARPTWTGTRPLSPTALDEDKVYDQILRFAKLQKQYGWWGLAYFEAILRAADAYVSEESQ